MPLTRVALSRLGSIWATSGPVVRAGLGLLVVVVAPFYIVLGPLWFDLAYSALRAVAGDRMSIRRRQITSIAVAVVMVGALLATSSAASTKTGPNPTATPVVAVASASFPGSGPSGPTAGPTASPTAALIPASATLDASSGDQDDDPGASPPPEATAPPANADATLPPAGRLPGEPDPALTSGALNPAVTPATINSTICVSGWTATIRPSSSYTTSLKIRQIAQYGYADTSTASYEEDHLIPLELGGAPSDTSNLWPQPYSAFLPDGRPVGARTKDGYETSLKTKVCAGAITLAEAQRDIGDHWVHYYYGIAITVETVSPATPTSPPTAVPTPAPTAAPTAGPPTPVPGTRKGAVCKDGSTSTATGSGACSHHGGVDHWLYW